LDLLFHTNEIRISDRKVLRSFSYAFHLSLLPSNSSVRENG
jgi:hypothetical protein